MPALEAMAWNIGRNVVVIEDVVISEMIPALAPARSDVPASVVDVFCGAGALSHGFKSEGFSIACGYDIDETCRYAFETNNDAPFVQSDVSCLVGRDVATEFDKDLPAVMIGCAPCQPFSRYSQGREDPKWKLLSDFARLVVETRPDVVSMENVPQLARFKGGEVFGAFVNDLKAAGYQVVWKVAECPDYGVPQSRSRLILIGSRLGCPGLPRPTRSLKDRVTVRDAIGTMPELDAGEIDSKDELHRSSKLSPVNRQRIRASKPGGTWRDWDHNLVTTCHKRGTGQSYTSVYGRMEWDRPSPTVTTQFYGYGNGRFGHPEQDRAISLREGAIFQSFPREYVFMPPGSPINFKEVGRMIGNAVPVLLARAIARAVAEHLDEVA